MNYKGGEIVCVAPDTDMQMYVLSSAVFSYSSRQ